MKVFAACLALIGSGILSYSILLIIRLYRIAPGKQKRGWSLLTALMACFVVGYLGFALILMTGVRFPVDLLVGWVFLGGALFVVVVLRLSKSTISELYTVNNSLEQLVQARTAELQSSSQSLRDSRQDIKAQMEFLESVLDALGHPFYVINVEDYSIVLANKASGFGDLDTARPLTCYQITHKSERPCNCENHPCPLEIIKKTGKPVTMEHVHFDNQGQPRNVEIHSYPITDGNGKLVQTIEYVLDITDRKIVERELLQAKREAEKANKAKSEFLANMSHEVRTPMNAIVGMTNLALATDLTSMQRHYLMTVRDSSELLLNIINDILDFSKIEAGRLELEKRSFQLGDIVNGVIRALKHKAGEKGLSLIFSYQPIDSSLSLSGDDFRLRQILFNLVGNAIKFTQEGEISVICEEELVGNELEVSFFINDTGIGIAPEAQKRIFDLFTQADTSISRSFGGTGLGLAISQRLVHMMGGEIRMTSVEGKGSTFFFALRFPVVAENEKECVPVIPDADVICALNILLVDDIATNRDLARMLLENDGHTVTVTGNGLDALRALAENHYDCVLLDIQMPGMDGLKVTELIRISEQVTAPRFEEHEEIMAGVAPRLYGGHIPLIAMTAYAMSGDRERCFKAGMDGYISKPFQPDQIRCQLNMLCRRAKG